MAIIDHSYFIGEISIPNISKVDVQDRMNAFIDKYETELLTNLLGYEVYNSFKAGGIDQVPTEQKWKDVLYGLDFTAWDGRTHHWYGFKGTGNYPRSPIANYVYFHWMKDAVSQTSALGEVSNKSENASLMSPAPKMVRAWNEMIDWLRELVSYLDKNTNDFPGWTRQNFWWLQRSFRYINEYGL